MALFLLPLLLLVSISLGEVVVKSNYPLRSNNLIDVMNDENYMDILYMLKSVEDIKKIRTYREEGRIIVSIERFPIIRSIEIRGNIALWDEDIKSFLGLREKEPLREENSEELEQRLGDFYRSKGFLDVKVKINIFVNPHGFADINIDIEEGDLYFLGGIEFKGLRSFSPSRLVYEGRLRIGEVFNKGKVEDAAFLIEDFFKEEGFIESFVFLQGIKKEKRGRAFKRVLMPSSGSDRENFKDKLFSLLMGVNNLITHPIASLKVLSGRGSLAVAEFRVIEGNRYVFLIDGNKSFSADRIAKLINKRDVFSLDIFSIQEIRERVEEFYRAKGFLDARVEVYLEEGNRVVIRIEEGDRYSLKYSVYGYEEELKLPEYYDEYAIRDALKKLELSLQEQGYAFPEIKRDISVDTSEKRVDLRIHINRGKRFILTDILLKGKDREVLNIIRRYSSSLPRIYDSKIIEELNKDIDTLFRNEGYLDGKYEADVRVEVSEREVRYTYIYSVIRGQRYRYGETIVYGNDKTVRREINYMLIKNSYFSEKDVDESTWNLVLSGIFTSVKIDTFIDRKRKLVHRLVELREDSRGYFEGALSYNTQELFKVELGVGLKNLFGIGLAGSLNYSRSQKYETYSAKLEDKFLFSRKFLGDVTLLKSVEFHSSYTLKSKGFSMNLGYRWKPRTILGVFFSSLRNRVLDYGAGSYQTNKYGIFFLFDERDNLLAPSRVFHTRFRASLSTGSKTYMKFEADTFLLFPLRIKEGMSIATRVAFGGAGKEAPVFDRFLLGGLRDMRGYEYETIGYPQGGRFYTFYRGELIIPLAGGLKGVIFTDVGSVADGFWDLFKSIKQDLGFSLALDLPVGLIRVDVAKPVEKIPRITSNFKVYLSVGFVY